MTRKLSLLIVLLCMGSLLHAQKCQSTFSRVMDAGDKMFIAYQEMRKDAAKIIFGKKVGNLAKVALDFQTQFYKTVKKVPGNGPGSIGPRYLTIPCKNIRGTLQGERINPARTFIAVPSGYDRIFITIKKTGGKAGAKITACVKNDLGHIVNSKIRDYERGKNNIGNEQKIVFYGMSDKYLTLFFDKTNGTNDFSYIVSIKGEFRKDQLKKHL